MEKVVLGKTRLEVTRLALGLAEIPRHDVSKRNLDAAGQVLNAALDGGINILDTAACYGATEEMIGETVAHRRDEYILATKAGHLVDDENSRPVSGGGHWTVDVIQTSIDRSLKRLKTDHLDLVQLHSCSQGVLEKGEVIDALVRAKDAGKTRFIGYSGDNEAARWAVESGMFDTLQTSLNLVEQGARTTGLLESAREYGLGVLIKRPMANGVWAKDESPYPYADEYFNRARSVNDLGPIQGSPNDPVLLAMGYTLSYPEVDVAIIGSHNPKHILSNIEMVESRLPISGEAVADLNRRFDELGANWRQLT